MVLVIGKSGDRAERVKNKGVQVISWDVNQDLQEIVRNNDSDVIHLYGDGFDNEFLLELSTIPGVPIVITGNFGWPNRSNLLDFADEYVFNSCFTSYRFRKLNKIKSDSFNNANLDMIYLPLARSDYCKSKNGDCSFDLRFRDEIQLIGKIGPKWSSMALKAMQIVSRERSDVKFVFVDPSDNMLEYIDTIGLLKDAIILDRIPFNETNKFYNSIDILAHSSHIGESFGNIFAEAMAQCTPVVTNSMPMRDNAQIELVDHDVTGYIANSAQSFADALLDLLSDREKIQSFGRSALEKAEREFNPDIIVQEWERKYQECTCGGQNDLLELSEQRRKCINYEAEYIRRLSNSYGEDPVAYDLEKDAWLTISNLPTHRHEIYNLLRYRTLNPEGGAWGGVLNRGVDMLRKRM